MKLSRRAKRMQQHHARKHDRNASLNMVSLMDIFTILVFFLLVNASNTDVLPSPKNIELPSASSQKFPAQNLVIAVNRDIIRLQGKPVARVGDAIKPKQKIIQPLYAALENLSGKSQRFPDKKSVTIMGDKQIPYALLKKIMLTCAAAKYTKLSFAVIQKQDANENR